MLFTDEAHGNFAKDPAVVKFHDMYYLYYSLKYEDDRFGVGIATSKDLENWEICGEVPLQESYEKNGIAAGNTDGKFRCSKPSSRVPSAINARFAR